MKLSVIIPIYNTPKNLLDHLKEIEYADSRFKYVYKSNSGVSETRNLGIKMAQGEYIFL